MTKHPPVAFTFHLIPHVHWDREWYLPRAAFQARLVPVLAEALEQLEADPAARFLLDGQTILLEDYLAARPEEERRIAALVERGALEIGPWYVLSDLLIPAAASLRTNLEEGARDSARFGARLPVLYSPDAFGHPAELPAIAAEQGLAHAVVRRGLGPPSGADRDFYRWIAPGGARMLVHHLPAGGYDVAIHLANPSADLSRAWSLLRRELVDRAVTTEIAVFLGADHHAMVRDIAGLRNRLQALETGHAVRISGLGEFFESVERAELDPPEVHGELRASGGHAWVLQGVHSARSRMKRRHGASELVLSRIVEPLARLAASRDGRDRDDLLRLAWRELLRCQFHDTLAGTTTDPVQHEQTIRLESVDGYAREIATGSIADLVDPGSTPTLALWNPLARERSGVVTAELDFFRRDVLVGPPGDRIARSGPGYVPFTLGTAAGDSIPVQVLATRRTQARVDSSRRYPDQDEVDRVWIAFGSPSLPAHGLALLSPRAGGADAEDRGLTVNRDSLVNRMVTLRVARDGRLALTDRRTGQRYDGLCELEDEPERGDLYTRSRGPGDSVRGGRSLGQTVIAAGPLVGAIETRWTMRSAGEGEILLRQLVVLLADSPIVRIRIDLDNQAVDHRLRARFPIGAGDAVIAGTALGTIRRSPATRAEEPGAIERAADTAPAHRFVAGGSDGRGLAVLSPGFFEYEWSAEQTLAITLLRSVGELSRDDLAERPGHAAWPQPTPEAQEPGRHTIHLALVPLDDGGLTGVDLLERQWEETFVPMQGFFLGARELGS